MKYKCLSIAGFDGSGGAGIQADLKTFSATGTYGMTVLTSLPIQNTCGVRKCYPIEPCCVKEQLEAIFDDIIPEAIKVGMLFSKEIIEIVSSFLKVNAAGIPIVLDPVMVAKSGDRLLEKRAIQALVDQMIPLSTIITPNIPEAKCLLGKNFDKDSADLKILDMGCKAVLIKGGHGRGAQSNDLFRTKDCKREFIASRIKSKNTHGTGCTLSAAIASFLAQGYALEIACEKAKAYLHRAILHSSVTSVGKGKGPVHHFYHVWSELKLQEIDK